MGILSKIKRQARKLMPKELSGIAQMAAPFVSGATGNPLLGAALSYFGQARAGEGKINPFKIAMASAPGLKFGKGAGTIPGTDKKIPIGFLKNEIDEGSSLRNILTGKGIGSSEGILNIGDSDFGTTADRFLFGGEKDIKVKGKNLTKKQLKDLNLPEGFTVKPNTKYSVDTVDKAGLFGVDGEFKLTDNALINAAIKQGSPFDVGEDLSLLKIGSAGLSLYSFIETNKALKTAEEAAAAVEAQMIADGITNQGIIDAATEEAKAIFNQLSLSDFNLANGGRIGFARGTPEDGIGSLNTGAESIMYQGTDGARSPEQTKNEQENLQAMGLPKGLSLEDAVKTFEMSIGRQPKDLGEVLEFFKNRKLSEGPVLPEDPTKPINPFGPRPQKEGITQMAAAGGRMGFMYGSDMGSMGGLSSLQTQPSDVTPPGMELDLRGGGFIPIGKAEKADDVPARVSKNEFVFTADAVKAAGGGSINEGAKKMYDTMKRLESQVA